MFPSLIPFLYLDIILEMSAPLASSANTAFSPLIDAQAISLVRHIAVPVHNTGASITFTDDEIFSAEPSDAERELECSICGKTSENFSVLGVDKYGAPDGTIDDISGEDARLCRNSLVCDRDECTAEINDQADSILERISSSESEALPSSSDSSEDDEEALPSSSDSSEDDDDHGSRKKTLKKKKKYMKKKDDAKGDDAESVPQIKSSSNTLKVKRSSSGAGMVSSQTAPKKKPKLSRTAPIEDDEDDQDEEDDFEDDRRGTSASGALSKKFTLKKPTSKAKPRVHEDRNAEKREKRLTDLKEKDGLVSTQGPYAVSNEFRLNSPVLAKVTEVFRREDLTGVIPNMQRALQMNRGRPIRDVEHAMSVLTDGKKINIGSCDLNDIITNVTTFTDANPSSNTHPVRLLLSIHNREGDKMKCFAVITGQELAEQLLFGRKSGAAFSTAMNKRKGYRGQVTDGPLNGYIFCLRLDSENGGEEEEEEDVGEEEEEEEEDSD